MHEGGIAGLSPSGQPMAAVVTLQRAHCSRGGPFDYARAGGVGPYTILLLDWAFIDCSAFHDEFYVFEGPHVG